MEKPRIAQEAFPLEIAPGIRMLGNYYFNLFLVAGETESALFEAGVSGVVDSVIAQLVQLGDEPDLLIVSHPHADHLTGLPGLRERYPGAEILAAAGAGEFAAHPKAAAALIQEDAFMSRRLAKIGFPPGRPSLSVAPDLGNHRVIREKTDLNLGGGVVLTLIPVSGHSPGNLMAFEHRHRVLFCSDSLGFHYPGRGFWPLFFTGATAYLSTLDLIETLNPKIICPAHQGPIRGTDIRDCLALSRQTTLEFIDRVRTDTRDDETLAATLFKESYRDEFTLYTQTNIDNCNRLLIRRARELTLEKELS